MFLDQQSSSQTQDAFSLFLLSRQGLFEPLGSEQLWMPFKSHSSVSLELERVQYLIQIKKKRSTDIFVLYVQQTQFRIIPASFSSLFPSASQPGGLIHLKSLLPHSFCAYHQISAKVVTQQFSLIISKLLQHSFMRTKMNFYCIIILDLICSIWNDHEPKNILHTLS